MNETFRVGVIRVITLPDQNQAEIHGRLMEQYVYLRLKPIRSAYLTSRRESTAWN